MSEFRPRIAVPRWAQRPSGLWIPSDLGFIEDRVEVEIGRGRSGSPVVAVLHDLPSSDDQVWAFVDERAIGLHISTLADQIRRASRVAFDSAAVYVATLSMATAQVPPERDRQIRLSQLLIIDPEIAAGIEAAVNEGRGTVVVSEQHLSALARLAVRYSDKDRSLDLSRDGRTLERTLLGCSALAMSDSERLGGEHPEPFDAVAFLIHSGAYYVREPPLNALARNNWIYRHLSSSPEAREHPQWRDVEAWAVETTGLGLLEQYAVGMAALGAARALDDDGELLGRGLLAPDWAAETARQLDLPVDRVLDSISAGPEWFAERFGEIEATFGIAEHAAAAGWTTSPFESRPFVRLRDGRLALWSARALLSWLTDGFYYRALTRASEDGAGASFTTFNGWLIERYAREVVETALPESKPDGSGRALRSVTYPSSDGEIDSPDIAIDYGADLILVEVRSGRLRLDTRMTGDPVRVQGDLRRLLIGKAQQLSRRIDDYRNGAFELAGVDAARVQRIWPIVLSGASFVMTELVYDWIVEEIGNHLHQPGVEPLTVLDMADWEQLCGLVESGWTVPALLRRKVGAYRRLDWRRMVHDDPFIDHVVRASAVARQADASFDEMLGRFGFNRSAPPTPTH